MVLGRKANFLLGKKNFGVKNQLFPRKKMVLGRKTKKSLCTLAAQFPKRFFLFSLGKRWFSFPKPCFPRKKLVFHAKNNLFCRKKLVFQPKTIFFLGKTKKQSCWSLAA